MREAAAATRDGAPAGPGVALRPYQADLLARISAEFRAGRRSVLGQMPTGAGKTSVAIEAARRAAERGRRVLFQAHTRVLVDQTSQRFAAAGLEHGIIMAGRSMTGLPVQIGSIQTLCRRLDRVKPFDLIVTDECHRAASASYAKTLSAWPGAYHIGLSATPSRLDGQGLGSVYEALVCGPTVRALIEAGYLARFRVFAPSVPDLSGVKTAMGDYEERALAEVMDRPALTGDVIGHFKSLAGDRQAIAYCCSVRHAEHVARDFRAAGIDADVLHSKLAAEEQRAAIARVRAGQLRVLVAIGMVSEGFDVPGVTCAILLRPTKSVTLACQQWGRANRGGDADSALVLDHAGLVLTHGLPDDDREWSLEGRRKGEKRQTAKIAVTTCRSCFAVYRSGLPKCPHCGESRPEKARTLETRDGQLVEVTPEVIREGELRCLPYQEALASCRTPEDIKAMARARGYKPAWAIRQAQQMLGLPPHGAAAALGYDPRAAYAARRA